MQHRGNSLIVRNNSGQINYRGCGFGSVSEVLVCSSRRVIMSWACDGEGGAWTGVWWAHHRGVWRQGRGRDAKGGT